ncbi:MAG: winged helix-turn-helix domain-containing protein [Nitrososphaera sp.]|jgi:predicted transcriptional regulator
MKYRSRTEIVAGILEAAYDGTTKTKIMYKAFLSYSQLKEYLSVLVENGLLDFNEAELRYKTSSKGRRFLETYQQMGEMVSPDLSE